MSFLRDPFAGLAFGAGAMLAMLALCFAVGHRLRPRWGLAWLALAMALAALRSLGTSAGLASAAVDQLAALLAASSIAALFTGLRLYVGLSAAAPWLEFVLMSAAWMLLRELGRWSGLPQLSGPLASTLLFVYLSALCAGRLRPVAGPAHKLAAVVLVLNPLLVVGIGIGVLGLNLQQLRGWSALALALVGLGLLMAAMGRLRGELNNELAARQLAEASLRLLNDSLEQRIRERTEELQGLVDGLESFNRMVSHDLQGPLGGLSGLAAVVRRALQAGDHARADQLLGLMANETRRLGELVNQLLVLARVTNAEPALRDTALDAVLAEALQALAVSHGEAALACVHAQRLPHAQVDPSLLRQVFVNLVGNALKFCRHAARPEVRVQAARSTDEVVVEVRDNGPGFDPALASELFQPFRRLHGGEVEGHGIGLSIVRRIVERHGGRVWAEGRPQQGASFFFSLPERDHHPQP